MFFAPNSVQKTINKHIRMEFLGEKWWNKLCGNNKKICACDRVETYCWRLHGCECGILWLDSAYDFDSGVLTLCAPYHQIRMACCFCKSVDISHDAEWERKDLFVGRNWNGIKAEKLRLYQLVNFCNGWLKVWRFVWLWWQKLHLSFETFKIPDLHINAEDDCAQPSHTHTRTPPQAQHMRFLNQFSSNPPEMVNDYWHFHSLNQVKFQPNNFFHQ